MKENDICKEFNHKCSRCMKDAPHYKLCCRIECGQHEFCRNCEFKKGELKNGKMV